MGMIPKQVKTEQRLSLGPFTMGIKRIFGIFATIILATIISNLINTSKLISFGIIILSLIFYFILSGNSKSHPQKTFFEGLIDFLIYKVFPKTIYSTQSKEWKNSEQIRKERLDEKRNKKAKANKKEQADDNETANKD